MRPTRRCAQLRGILYAVVTAHVFRMALVAPALPGGSRLSLAARADRGIRITIELRSSRWFLAFRHIRFAHIPCEFWFGFALCLSLLLLKLSLCRLLCLPLFPLCSALAMPSPSSSTNPNLYFASDQNRPFQFVWYVVCHAFFWSKCCTTHILKHKTVYNFPASMLKFEPCFRGARNQAARLSSLTDGGVRIDG